jgi:beta-galactosidase GanA
MIFGAQYYRPPFPARQHWAADLAAMRGMGFNTVKIWAVWNWIETAPGCFDFSEQRELRAAAWQAGLKVVVNAIPEGAPAWAIAGNEDALYRTADGRIIDFGGPANLPSAGWPGFCADKPQAAALIERFIEAVAADCLDDPNVIAIDVWNEPHLEPMFDYRNDLLCYCDHSRAQFRTWLLDKYGGLDALNNAWFRRMSSWDEVQPPPRFGTWTDMLDWRRFCVDNLARQLRGRVTAARRGAPGIPVQTHVAYSAVLGNKLAGGLGNELGDEFSLAREVDIFGLSSFPKWLQGPDHAFVHLAHAEVVAEASRGRSFYQVELQGGGGKAGLLGGAVPDARDVTLWNYNLVAAGGKGVLYWQWAAEPAGLESPGFGLVRFDGGPTERSLAAARCASELSDPRLDQARPLRPVNGIYLSRKSQLLCFAAGRQEELYAGSVAGAYRAAYTAGLPVRFVHEDYLESLAGEGLRVLYVPMALALDERECATLRRFVEAGGLLVGEAAFGLYDAGGRLDEASAALGSLFGLAHRDFDARLDDDPVMLAGTGAGTGNGAGTAIGVATGSGSGVVSGSGAATGAGSGFVSGSGTGSGSGTDDGVVSRVNSGTGFHGVLYRHLVETLTGTTVLARFSDGWPAITSRPLGRGQAVFVATLAALAGHRGVGASRNLVAGFFDRRGYQALDSLSIATTTRPELTPQDGANPTTSQDCANRTILPDGASQTPPQDDANQTSATVVRLLETDQEWAIVAVNHRPEAVLINLSFSAAAAGSGSDFRSGDPTAVTIEVPACSGKVHWVPKPGQQ